MTAFRDARIPTVHRVMCTFILAVFLWGEPLGGPRHFTFILIWIALAVYTVGMLRKGRMYATSPRWRS